MVRFIKLCVVLVLIGLAVAEAKSRRPRKNLDSSSQQTDDYDEPPSFTPPNNWPKPPKECMPPWMRNGSPSNGPPDPGFGPPFGMPPGPPPPGCKPPNGFGPPPNGMPFGPPPNGFGPFFSSNARRAPNRRRRQRG